ncbi:MAG: YqaE/Pmp3 family membrane protein [Planctomycetes bacterium]|nr:YqaE/Pmp3 family membrane protein [Planctomycetota bacterium]
MKMLLLVILAILLPPVAVFLQVGLTKHFWINIILCLLVLPAMIHALIVVVTGIKS